MMMVRVRAKVAIMRLGAEWDAGGIGWRRVASIGERVVRGTPGVSWRSLTE